MDQTKDCTRELIAKAHNNDKEAREKLVTDNLGLIWNIIKRFKGRGTEQEDLFQIGCIGLIKAIDNFNLDMDVAFSTYAVPMITGEIRRFLRDDGMVKVSRSIKENAVKSMRAAGQLRDTLGCEPTVEQIAAACELSVEDITLVSIVLNFIKNCNKPSSFIFTRFEINILFPEYTIAFWRFIIRNIKNVKTRCFQFYIIDFNFHFTTTQEFSINA